MLDPQTQVVWSYQEFRPGALFDLIPFHGLQYLLFEYLQGPVATRELVKEAAELSAAHHGTDAYFNTAMWNRIVDVHGGRLPISIKAVPEGTIMPPGNIVMSVENTDDAIVAHGGAAPLTNALESLLLHTWNASTVAALSYASKQMITKHVAKTDREGLGFVPYMLHDFGYRGVSSDESARTGGAGHLLNFYGTDTLQAVQHLKKYYGATGFIGFSVAASEHSVMTAGGRDGEFEVLKQILKNPKFRHGILSLVADSYDIYNFVKTISQEPFRSLILSREPDSFGLCKVVVRPDSPTRQHPIPGDQMAELSRLLAEGFGGTTTTLEGFTKLNPKIGLLWGDGIDPISGIDEILTTTSRAGFAATNYVFGCGGGLLQKVNRDTLRTAFKCSAQKRGGVWHDVYKDPLDATKASKRGRLKLNRWPGSHGCGWSTNRLEEEGSGLGDQLVEVFRNGEVTKSYTLEEIRRNARF